MHIRQLSMPILFLLLSAADTCAQSSSSFSLEPIKPYAKGNWDLSVHAAYTHPTHFDRHQLIQGVFGAGYAPINNIQLSGEIVGIYVAPDVQGGEGWGGGMNLRSRFQLFQFGRSNFFLDLSAGWMETDHPLPAKGTHFNFTETAGLGFSIPLNENFFLLAGGRFQHVSNAGISRNPGYDGVQAYFGLMLAL